MTGFYWVLGVLAAGLLLAVYACLVQAGRADRQAEREERMLLNREKEEKQRSAVNSENGK